MHPLLRDNRAAQAVHDLDIDFFGAHRANVHGYEVTPAHSIDPSGLEQPHSGKMFGLLLARDRNGRRIALRAFSGQWQKNWMVPGWAPPPFSPEEWNAVDRQFEPEIKRLSQDLAESNFSPQECQQRRKIRRDLSRAHMIRLHQLYWLHNFSGERRPMVEIFGRTPPTGAGECCAPKLLNWCAQLKLLPEALCEFYWGAPNRSATRKHKRVYLPCREKCEPILTFLLRGIDT
jgi:hypothetical protein